MNIGIDIDGVIADLVSAMLPLLSKACGHNVTHADITEYNIGKALNIEQHMHNIWKAVYSEALLIRTPTIEGALEGLNRLSNHTITLITGRPLETQIITVKWLVNNSIKYSKLIFSQQGKHLHCDGLDIFIDDYFEEASKVAGAGIPTLLFNQPWNQSPIDCNKMKRVRNWGEVTESIRSFASHK